MQTRRRELLYLAFISLCSLAAIRASAQQAYGADGNVGRASGNPRAEEGTSVQLSVSSDSRLITLELKRAPLKEALRAVAREAGVQLIYNDRDIPADLPVTATISDATVERAVALILRGTGLRARPTDDGIVIERQEDRERSDSRTLQGSLSGRVTDAATGRPIAAVKVRLEEVTLATTTSSEGTYRLPAVPAGTYTLTARHVGYERIVKTVVVADGEEATADLAMTPAPTILDQVVTTGTVIPTEVKAIPSPISLITADQIERQHPSTLTAIMRQAVPTAVAFDEPGNPNATQISVRGASSLRGSGNMKIFVDGIEATDYAFTPVDPASIDRIEVVRGPQAATIYGADAAGGVIQIFTKRGESASRPRIDAQAAFGLLQTPYTDFETVSRQQYSGSIHGGGDNVSYNFGGGYRHLADYLPNGEISRQSASSIYGGMQYSSGVIHTDLSARYYDSDAPLVVNPLTLTTGYVPASRPYYTKVNSVNETIGARLTAIPTTWWRHQLTLGIDRRILNSAQAQPRYTTPSDTLLSITNRASRKISLGYNTSITGALGSGTTGSLSVGVDHYVQELNVLNTSRALNIRGSIKTSPAGSLSGSITSTTNTGYFAQSQIGLHDALFITAGVRAEDNSTFGADYGMAVLPRIGLTVVRDFRTTTVKLRASYGRALRTPTEGQASGSVSGTSIQLANTHLAAEQQRGWDAGVDVVFGGKASLSLTGYDQIARDLIAFMQVATTPLPTYQYQNVGAVSNRGLEVEGKLSLNNWLQVAMQYGYVRSRFVSVGITGGPVQVGDEPLGVPANTAGATVTVVPARRTSLTAGVSYVGGVKQTEFLTVYRCLASLAEPECPSSFLSSGSMRDFTISYPSFSKFNVALTQELTNQVEVFLAVDNVANSHAYEGRSTAPVVGRNTMLGLNVRF